MSPKTIVRIVVLVLVGSCKVEPIETFSLDETYVVEFSSTVQPWSFESSMGEEGAALWGAAIQKYLGFIRSEELSGRRPGTPGASLTTGFVLSEFERAGLSPNGPDLGWSQAVGIRILETRDVTLSIVRPAAPSGQPAARVTFDEGLWLRHRGMAGPRALNLRIIDAQAPKGEAGGATETETDTGQRLDRLLVVSTPSQQEGEPEQGQSYQTLFEDAWHDGMSVAVLPIPDKDPEALAIASRWREPDVQSLLLGRDPPAALDLQGFVDPKIHAGLREAGTIPGSTVEIQYEATERWFQDDNIIGRIAGSRRPEQAVVVVAPWDAGGLDLEADSAADEDAGAVAAFLAVVDGSGRWRKAGRRPERSIIFVAEAAGSLGHRGIERFIEASGIRLANIIAVVNLERLGGTGTEVHVIDGNRSTLGSTVVGLEATAQLSESDEHHYGHSSFLARGIPAVTLSRPLVAMMDGSMPLVSPATLRLDAQLAFRVVWSLADQAEAPRLVLEEVAEP